MPKRRAGHTGARGRELLGLFLGLFAGYFAAEALLGQFAHYTHWLGAFALAALGYYGVLAWYRLRGRRR